MVIGCSTPLPVAYRPPGAMGADWIDIYNRMYRERILFLGRQVDVRGWDPNPRPYRRRLRLQALDEGCAVPRGASANPLVAGGRLHRLLCDERRSLALHAADFLGAHGAAPPHQPGQPKGRYETDKGRYETHQPGLTKGR